MPIVRLDRSRRRSSGSVALLTIAGAAPPDPESALDSRSGLLAAGKELFARLRYEQTSSVASARAAATSESQLVRYFDGKAGLLPVWVNVSLR